MAEEETPDSERLFVIYTVGLPKINVRIVAQTHSVHFIAKMKFSLAALALPIAVNAAHYSSSEYASGAVHQKLMKLKSVRMAIT